MPSRRMLQRAAPSTEWNSSEGRAARAQTAGALSGSASSNFPFKVGASSAPWQLSYPQRSPGWSDRPACQ
eukprot:scaffold10059_cov123-Isochrysis_galbana.AAC.16